MVIHSPEPTQADTLALAATTADGKRASHRVVAVRGSRAITTSPVLISRLGPVGLARALPP